MCGVGALASWKPNEMPVLMKRVVGGTPIAY